MIPTFSLGTWAATGGELKATNKARLATPESRFNNLLEPPLLILFPPQIIFCTNIEIQNPKQIPMTKIQNAQNPLWNIRHSNFDFVSDFVFRIYSVP
jgi:hypothetical protein